MGARNSSNIHLGRQSKETIGFIEIENQNSLESLERKTSKNAEKENDLSSSSSKLTLCSVGLHLMAANKNAVRLKIIKLFDIRRSCRSARLS